MPNFCWKASASSAESGAVPDVTARMLLEVLAAEVGVQHHSQCGGYQRHRPGAMPAYGVGPRLQLEPLQQDERPGLRNTLQHPEHAADVYQRCVDDRDAAADVRRRRGPLRFGTHDAVREHVVGQVDSLRRAGGATGQHPHCDTGSAGIAALAGRHHARLGVGL